MIGSDESITYGSLCSGYDGIGQGLGLVPSWVAETEPAMKRVLKREHGGVPDLGDIKTADFAAAGFVRVMSSGDPCQAISIAGRQEGSKDPRFLWPWVRDAYRQIWPDVLFFENVANIVSHDGGRTLAERHEHLREDGYEVRWTVLGACAVGAPHHRHRYYAAAIRHDGLAVPPEAVRMGGRTAICGAPRGGGRQVLPTPAARDGDGRGEGSPAFWERRRLTRPVQGVTLGAAINLLPTPNARDGGQRGTPTPEHARRRAADPMRSLNLEDAVSAFLLPTPMADRSGNNRGGAAGREGQPVRPSLDSVSALLPTPRATDVGTGGRRSSDGWRPQLGQAVLGIEDVSTWGKYAAAIALWEQVTGIPAPEPTEPNSKGDGRRLNPALPEWMMGLRPGLLTGELSRGEALKGAGNGVVPQAVSAAWRILMGDVEL